MHDIQADWQLSLRVTLGLKFHNKEHALGNTVKASCIAAHTTSTCMNNTSECLLSSISAAALLSSSTRISMLLSMS